MRERFHARDPRSLMLRFHAQTAGSSLTAQQPENNLVRVALQSLAAVLGGCQSLHANALDEALGFAKKNDDRFQEADLHRLKGELLLAESPDRTAAEECFQRAIETARCQQSKGWELRATISLARLWQRHGRRDAARAALAAVYGTYTEGFTTPDLVDAAALLESLA